MSNSQYVEYLSFNDNDPVKRTTAGTTTQSIRKVMLIPSAFVLEANLRASSTNPGTGDDLASATFVITPDGGSSETVVLTPDQTKSFEDQMAEARNLVEGRLQNLVEHFNF